MKLLSIMLGLLIMTSTTHAREDGGKKFEKGEFLKKELNLTDEQLEKVREIRKGRKENMRAEKEKFRQLKKDFHEAMKNPETTNEDLKKKFDAFQNARDKFQRERFDMMLKMRQVLTPEQRVKFMEMKKDRKGKHKTKWKQKK